MNPTDTRTPRAVAKDDILRMMKNEVIERVRFILREDLAAGLRLQVPGTDIFIIAGSAGWIADQAILEGDSHD